MVLETPLAAALNHLLRREAWARKRLAPHAGEVIHVRAGLLPTLRLAIGAEGLFEPADAARVPDLVVALKVDAPASALTGEQALLRAVDVTGNARLAEAVVALVRHLRWDYEEDLSRVFGDVLAHRMGEGLRALAAWAPDTAQRLSESLAAYVTDEAEVLLGRAELEAFAAEVSSLRDAVERLEARMRHHG